MTTSRYLRRFIEQDATTPEQIKKRMTQDNLEWLLNKTARMFEYYNLPPTIPAVALERLLQFCGSCCIWRVPASHKPIGHGPSFNYSVLSTKNFDGDDIVHQESEERLYAFPFSFADAPDPYDEPYQVIVTSPGFNPTISETLEINKDCVIIRNDTSYKGLYKLHKKYAELLTEAELSLRSTLVVLRSQLLFIAKTETQRRAVEAYINSRAVGEPGFIVSHDMGTPLETFEQNGRSNAVELAVNGLQAIKAAWYNEIGLNPSFSMKREYTSAQEIDTNTDLLMPIIDDMYESRRIGVENINALFGTNISVEKSSAWRIKQESVEAIQAQENADIALTYAQADAEVLSAKNPIETDEKGEESNESEHTDESDSTSSD